MKEGTEYTIIYPANMKNARIYTVKIEFRGNCAGTEEQTTGYEIAYSASSKFPKKKTGTVRISKSSTISKKRQS